MLVTNASTAAAPSAGSGVWETIGGRGDAGGAAAAEGSSVAIATSRPMAPADTSPTPTSRPTDRLAEARMDDGPEAGAEDGVRAGVGRRTTAVPGSAAIALPERTAVVVCLARVAIRPLIGGRPPSAQFVDLGVVAGTQFRLG